LLEGRTVTIAAAALQQRVMAVVAKFGGNILLLQVDLRKTQIRAPSA
jgi:Type II secretion system (T2SS), protein M subtype b